MAQDTNPTRTAVDLNGDWEKYVHGKFMETVTVPSSLRPSGLYRLRRSFLLPRLANGQRAFIHFDGINYHGRVFVNGQDLGTTIAFLPHEFDCTKVAVEGRNTVEVQIADALPEPDGTGKDDVDFSNTFGWEPYGGIIRDAYVDIRPAAFIDNVRFGYKLSDGYDNVSCTTQVFISSADARSGDCELSLWWRNTEVAKATTKVDLKPGVTEAEIKFDVKTLALWSPEEPNLYELRATLKTPNSEDRWKTRTGFREFKTQGRNFLLNGQRVVLNGVCRHDTWKDQGFTLSRQQQIKDMRMIKAMGCNFVRLVHYPHDRRIVEIADEIGLMVSDEPGFWNMDFDKLPAGQIDLGCHILEGAIRRDWNSPAVIVWLLGNECAFPVSYMKRGKAICDKLDPIGRLVTVAHTYGKFPAVKETFDEAGMDFYDWHAYEYESGKFERLANSFGPSKPLTFTEWGWEVAGPKAVFYERDFDAMLELVQQEKTAGHVFWSWSDVPEFNRSDWSTTNGLLRSGAVTENREIRQPIYDILAALFNGRRSSQETRPAPDRPTVVPLRTVPFVPGSKFESADLQPLADSASGKQSWKALEGELEKFWGGTRMSRHHWKQSGSKFELWTTAEVNISGVTFRSPMVDGRVRPVLLTGEVSEVTIPIQQACTTLHILGQVAFGNGYPLTAAPDLFGNVPPSKGHLFGDTVAEYTLHYAGGKTQVVPVRNGIEVVQANRIHGASRILPIAINAQPALEYIKDIVREQYQILLLSVPVGKGKLESVSCKLIGGQGNLAIFAMTTEKVAA